MSDPAQYPRGYGIGAKGLLTSIKRAFNHRCLFNYLEKKIKDGQVWFSEMWFIGECFKLT